jgi:hypothetical protein
VFCRYLLFLKPVLSKFTNLHGLPSDAALQIQRLAYRVGIFTFVSGLAVNCPWHARGVGLVHFLHTPRGVVLSAVVLSFNATCLLDFLE